MCAANYHTASTEGISFSHLWLKTRWEKKLRKRRHICKMSDNNRKQMKITMLRKCHLESGGIKHLASEYNGKAT